MWASSDGARAAAPARADDPEDWNDLLAWQQGDQDAAEALARRYFPLLMRFFVNKVRDLEDATELVAETFLGCSAGKRELRPRGSFRSLLFAIAMNKLRGYYRTQGKRRRELEDFAEVCVARSSPSAITSLIARAQEARLLVRALRRLSLDQQIVVELVYFEELSGTEIAALLGVPRPTVYTHLRRGRSRLAAIVQELSGDRTLAESTMTGLATWARQVRSQVERLNEKVPAGE